MHTIINRFFWRKINTPCRRTAAPNLFSLCGRWIVLGGAHDPTGRGGFFSAHTVSITANRKMATKGCVGRGRRECVHLHRCKPFWNFAGSVAGAYRPAAQCQPVAWWLGAPVLELEERVAFLLLLLLLFCEHKMDIELSSRMPGISIQNSCPLLSGNSTFAIPIHACWECPFAVYTQPTVCEVK